MVWYSNWETGKPNGKRIDEEHGKRIEKILERMTYKTGYHSNHPHKQILETHEVKFKSISYRLLPRWNSIYSVHIAPSKDSWCSQPPSSPDLVFRYVSFYFPHERNHHFIFFFAQATSCIDIHFASVLILSVWLLYHTIHNILQTSIGMKVHLSGILSQVIDILAASSRRKIIPFPAAPRSNHLIINTKRPNIDG